MSDVFTYVIKANTHVKKKKKNNLIGNRTSGRDKYISLLPFLFIFFTAMTYFAIKKE
jgi:hypothetical protein